MPLMGSASGHDSSSERFSRMTALPALPSSAQNAANGRMEPKLSDAAKPSNGSNVGAFRTLSECELRVFLTLLGPRADSGSAPQVASAVV